MNTQSSIGTLLRKIYSIKLQSFFFVPKQLTEKDKLRSLAIIEVQAEDC